jgi:hypothetical protein
MARRSLDLIEAMHAAAEAAQPITGRGIGYKLFTAGLIPSMTRGEMQRVYRLLKEARERDQIPWDWIVDETRALERASAVGFRVMHGFSGATTIYDVSRDDDGRELIALYVGVRLGAPCPDRIHHRDGSAVRRAERAARLAPTGEDNGLRAERQRWRDLRQRP